MNEPVLKKKNILNKIINNQFLVTTVTVFMVAFILIGASYAILSSEDELDTTNVNIKIGNMQAVLSSSSEPYTFTEDYQKGVSDASGMSQDSYDFSLTNTGDSNIEYYEIRLVNQENKSSTLPHKYVRFSIKSNDLDYSLPVNLGEASSILYSGTNLESGEKINFELKMWIDEMSSYESLNKKLYGAIEVTLYQKYDAYDYYVLYDANGGDFNPVRTTLQESITNVIPVREGYEFIGWSTTSDGNVTHYSGSSYEMSRGMTLYAVWSEKSE